MATSGTKRKPSTKGKSSTDFKRLKAKVGKKVAKAANETDTSFRKASLYLSDQSIKTQSANAIISQKGRSLADLALQFGHPAGTARHSAVKGLINIVKEHTAINLRAHLHALVQIASKAFVDDEDIVRKAGYILLEEVMNRHEKPSLVPFVSLLVAYTSSAMHSLDQGMRSDGAKTVGLLASFFGSMMHASTLSLLPPYVNLLSDRERRKDLGCILDSLVSLLSVVVSRNQDQHDLETRQCDEHQTNHLFITGGRSRNAFLQRNRRFPQLSDATGTLSSVLKSQGKKSTSHDELNSEQSQNGKEARNLYNSFGEIQVKLCDLLVEMIEEESEEHASTRKSNFTFPEVKRLVQAIQLIYATRPTSGVQCKEFIDPVDIRTAKLLMETFPISGYENCGRLVTRDETDFVNALITRTLLIVAFPKCTVDRSKDLIETLLSYWLPLLAGQGDTTVSGTQIDVVQDIYNVLSKQLGFSSTYSHQIRHELYKTFLTSPDQIVARSIPGRKAITMLVETSLHETMRSQQDCTEDLMLMSVIEGIPFYLKSWSTDFENESAVILEFLRSLGIYGNHDVCSKLRESIFSLLEKEFEVPSLFENHSENLQRKYVELIRILESPPKSVLRALAVRCASSSEGAAKGDYRINDEIFVMIRSIRKSIPMVDYFSFLVESMGVPSSNSRLFDASEFEDILLSLDHRVLRSSKAAVECGSLNSLRMLKPQLFKWMEPTTGDDPSMIDIIRNRVCLCLLSYLMSELCQTNVPLSHIAESLGLLQCFYGASRNLLIFLTKVTALAPQIEERLLSPICALIKLDSNFFEIVKTIQNDTRNNMSLDEGATSRLNVIIAKLAVR